jgi:hypothetical protein
VKKLLTVTVGFSPSTPETPLINQELPEEITGEKTVQGNQMEQQPEKEDTINTSSSTPSDTFNTTTTTTTTSTTLSLGTPPPPSPSLPSPPSPSPPSSTTMPPPDSTLPIEEKYSNTRYTFFGPIKFSNGRPCFTQLLILSSNTKLNLLDVVLVDSVKWIICAICVDKGGTPYIVAKNLSSSDVRIKKISKLTLCTDKILVEQELEIATAISIWFAANPQDLSPPPKRSSAREKKAPPKPTPKKSPSKPPAKKQPEPVESDEDKEVIEITKPSKQRRAKRQPVLSPSSDSSPPSPPPRTSSKRIKNLHRVEHIEEVPSPPNTPQQQVPNQNTYNLPPSTQKPLLGQQFNQQSVQPPNQQLNQQQPAQQPDQ